MELGGQDVEPSLVSHVCSHIERVERLWLKCRSCRSKLSAWLRQNRPPYGAPNNGCVKSLRHIAVSGLADSQLGSAVSRIFNNLFNIR